MAESALFSPLRIGSLLLPGRFIKTATSESRAGPNGQVIDALIDFYRPIAEAATPLIITGNIYTSRAGQSTPMQTGADDDRKIVGLAQLAEAVHRGGSLLVAQLNHCGRQVLPRSVGATDVVSASAVADPVTGTRPRPLSLAEIEGIVGEFAAAAWRCREAGFDGIQIHAGHGYLLSQFLTPHTNRRNDRYGGSPENRMRLLREVFAAIRERVGSSYPVLLKINGSDYLPLRRGLDTSQLVAVARALEHDGLDAVEVSVGHYESGYPMVRGSFHRAFHALARGGAQYLPPLRRAAIRLLWPVPALACNLIWPARSGFNLDYAAAFKKALQIPVISVGGFVERTAMEQAITSGRCDAVAVGRALIADPYLYRHLRDNTSGPVCVACNGCVGIAGAAHLDCIHPRVGAEKKAMLSAGLRSR